MFCETPRALAAFTTMLYTCPENNFRTVELVMVDSTMWCPEHVEDDKVIVKWLTGIDVWNHEMKYEVVLIGKIWISSTGSGTVRILVKNMNYEVSKWTTYQ